MGTQKRTVIKGGQVIAFGGDHQGQSDVIIENGKISTDQQHASAGDTTIIDATNAFVVPALTDIHTHIYWGGTALGVDPNIVAHRSAMGTFVDAGSAGAGNFSGLKSFIFDPLPFHAFAFLNIAFPGIFGFSRRVMVGECCDMRLIDAEGCIETALAHPDRVVGIKVRAGKNASGENGGKALEVALDVAERLNLPVMCHIDLEPPTIEEVLKTLRKGDIITHCCRPEPNAPTKDGRIRDAVWGARERGVHFDIGHGMGGFSFKVCREMMAEGFVPDLTSSDIHALSIDGPAYDLLTTINKMIALGVDVEAALAAGSATPAKVIGRPELGRISHGDEANLAVLRWAVEPWTFYDASGEALHVERRLVCDELFVKGKRVNPPGANPAFH